jgi:phosphate transport system permease protein
MATINKTNGKYWRSGEPMVWVSGAALAITLLCAIVLLVVIITNGLGVFWPSPLQQLELKNGQKLIGQLIQTIDTHDASGLRRQYKIANRDLYGLDFRWIDETEISAEDYPQDIIVLERMEYGDFFGVITKLDPVHGNLYSADIDGLNQALKNIDKDLTELKELDDKLKNLAYDMEQLRLKDLKLAYKGLGESDAKRTVIAEQRAQMQNEFGHLIEVQTARNQKIRQFTVSFVDANGTGKEIVLADIVQAYAPNQMGTWQKVLFYMQKLVELVSGEPREANTEGGLFPAIFGTVMLIFVMSLFSFPLGVIAAIYLREYAKEGPLVRVVRIAVNNLAGIPSIVYGIFGLGFFIYGIGHTIDTLFFPERLPTPTFGTGGLLWASLTLALLTVPVVIVSTEEALGAIPREMREGSYALGATKFQTLIKILLPMASPGILTGLILSMARAAGEVAPLMITGVVKLAPTLAVDGHFPFMHLDRKFMHLGFHIYDIGFQSPNVEAAKPMVFVTTLLLILIVLAMSSVAIHLRNKMKKRYTFGTF